MRWLVATATLLLLASPTAAQSDRHWVGSWGAPPAFPNGSEVNNQTIRQFVRLSLGGRAIRIRITNELGLYPLVIGAAHVAQPGGTPGSIEPSSDHELTFGGRSTVTIPPGAPAISDPVSLDVATLDTIAVSLYVPRNSGPSATHPLGLATAFQATGDQTGAATLINPVTNDTRLFLSGVEVDAPGLAAVVTMGDSITDGFRSTANANRRWPDVLAERLAAAKLGLSVVSAAISGNRVLHDLPQARFGPAALARLDRDVLAVPGVRTVIVLESINDIGNSGGLPEQQASAGDIIVGLRQIAERVHARGLRIIGGTLTPDGVYAAPGYYTPEKEAERLAVNHFIRDGGAFDGVIDFDAVMRDPGQPNRIRPDYDSGDHLHPNDAGYRAMGEAIDLKLLTGE